MNDSSRENAANSAPSSATTPGARAGARWYGSAPALLVAVIALLIASWQWYDARTRTSELRHDVSERLAQADTRTREGRSVIEQGRAAMTEMREKLGALEKRLAESQKQQAALEALYQELWRNREEWTYAEIEQSLFVASQQLQLGGNAKAALIALQAVDARLQRLDRPQLTALRKAVNRDIERLKAAPYVDMVTTIVQLDGVVAQVDRLPLAMDTRPRPEQAAAVNGESEGNMWTRFWRDTWKEVKQLVRVQEVDQPEDALLAPSQGYFLRENLKLRLVGARVALLARDATSYKADLKAASDWLGRYYDTRNKGVAQALATLRGLQEVEAGIELPDIGATLEAMRALRTAPQRSGR
jgi:uroporphyrin-III C-methyltransferase